MIKSYILVLFFLFFGCSKSPEEKKIEVNSKFSEALDYYNNGNYNKAESIFKDILEIEKETGRHNYLAHIQLYLGLIGYYKSKFYNALDYYKNALSEYESMQDLQNQVVVLTNMGGIYAYLYQYDKAIETYYKSYNLSRITADKESESIALSNIASAYQGIENYPRAFEFYNKAIIMNKINDDFVSVALNINNIGELYFQQKKYDTAYAYFMNALSYANRVKDINLQGIILKNLGNFYSLKGKNEEAIDFYLNSIFKARLAPNPDLEKEALNNLGNIYYKTYQHDKAKIAFEEALNIAKGKMDCFSEAFFLNSIGNTYRFLYIAGDKEALQKSEQHYEDALKIINEIKFEPLESTLYFNLASVYELRNEINKALEFYNKAVNLKENLIEPPVKSFLFELLKTDEINYNQIAQILLRLNRKEEAFLYLQKISAISISDSLKRRSSKLPNYEMETYRNNYLNLKDEISALYYSYIFELSRNAKESNNTKIVFLKETINSKKSELKIMESNLIKKNEIFKNMIVPPIFSLNEFQAKLNPESLVVNYFPSDSLLFIISISKYNFNIEKINLLSGVFQSQKNMYFNSFAARQKNYKSNKQYLNNELFSTLQSYLIKPIEMVLANYSTVIILTNSGEDEKIYQSFFNNKKVIYKKSFFSVIN